MIIIKKRLKKVSVTQVLRETHSCIFPWKAEEGVGATPVSHVLQH